MVIQFKNIGIHLGTRLLGAEVRSDIIKAINTSDLVIFDLSEVETISNSFADECFAKLTLFFSLEEVKTKTTFINATPFIRTVIANSFRERLILEKA
jgi:hypothetical protein